MKIRESSEPYFDLFDDFDLIVSSFQTQYGIRIYSRDFKQMKWKEFAALLSGLGPTTPLGRVVAIRSEEDKEVLKNFTKEQHKIRNEYRSKINQKIIQNTDKEQYEKDMQNILNMFKSIGKVVE